MKKCLLLVLLCILLANAIFAQVQCVLCYNQNNSLVSSGTTNYILNGGFETTLCDTEQVFCPQSYVYSCDMPNWTTVGGYWSYPKIYRHSYCKIPEGINAVYMGNYYYRACSQAYHDVTCLTNNGCTTAGFLPGFPLVDDSLGGPTGLSIQQTVSGLLPGSIYALEFWAGGEWNYYVDGLFAVDVGFGNTYLRNKPTHPDSGVGTRYIVVFTANSPLHTVKFTNWGHMGAGVTEVVIDDVKLYKADELEIGCITGIEEEVKEAKLYPNPTKGMLTIQLPVKINSQLIVYDMLGRKMLQDNFNGSITANVSDWPHGMYLYQIINSKGLTSQGKFIKE